MPVGLMSTGQKFAAPINAKTKSDANYRSLVKTSFEKEWVLFKDVNHIPKKHKMASLRFHDILPKEQFYGLLWGYKRD
jgi:hypothetical protein